MEEDPTSEIDIQVVRMHRDMAMQRRTGLYTGSITVEIAHSLGSFALTFQVERLPATDSEQQAVVREKIVQFAELLKVARIQIPKSSPDQHSALTPVNADRTEIMGFSGSEGSSDVWLTLKTKRGGDQRFTIEANNLVEFAQSVIESLGDEE